MPMPCDDDSIAQEISIYYGGTAARETVLPAYTRFEQLTINGDPSHRPRPPKSLNDATTSQTDRH